MTRARARVEIYVVLNLEQAPCSEASAAALLAAGLSRYEPDPLAAIERAEVKAEPKSDAAA
jgi:hypothetical protein